MSLIADPEWLAWAVGGAVVAAVAFLLRVGVNLGRSPSGVDTWYYLAYADAVRARPGLDVRLPQYLLQDERQSYPPLFPSLLAADMDIGKKKGPDGKLLLVLLFPDKKETAEEMARHLERIKQIRGIPIRVETANGMSLESFADRSLAGIFLTGRFSRGLDSVIAFGRKRQVIVFSPFKGDIQRGVPGGIFVSNRILPYINAKAMRSAGIRIKPFFSSISKHYE